MKKIILILALLGVFQFSFGIDSKEYNEKGLKAYKEKDYSNAIKNFYNAVIESEKDKNVTTEEKAGYYSDYALALIKGHLVEHGIFVALYSNNLTENKKLRAANFYNISLALDMIEKNEWEFIGGQTGFFPVNTVPELISQYSKLAKDMSLYLKDKAPQPKEISDDSLIGSLMDESTYKDGKNSISKLEFKSEDKFTVKYTKYGEDKEKITGELGLYNLEIVEKKDIKNDENQFKNYVKYDISMIIPETPYEGLNTSIIEYMKEDKENVILEADELEEFNIKSELVPTLRTLEARQVKNDFNIYSYIYTTYVLYSPPHGLIFYNTYNISKETGKEIRLEDLLGKGYEKKLVEKINNETNDGGDPAYLDSLDGVDFRFYLEDKNIVIMIIYGNGQFTDTFSFPVSDFKK